MSPCSSCLLPCLHASEKSIIMDLELEEHLSLCVCVYSLLYSIKHDIYVCISTIDTCRKKKRDRKCTRGHDCCFDGKTSVGFKCCWLMTRATILSWHVSYEEAFLVWQKVAHYISLDGVIKRVKVGRSVSSLSRQAESLHVPF